MKKSLDTLILNNMRKKLILSTIALLGLVINGNAQLLWKISGNGLKEPSYIFGTLHVATASICDSVAGFDDAFNSCKQLYGEIDMSDVQAMAQEMMKSAMLPQDILLNTLYSDEEYKMIDSVLIKELGVGVEKFQRLKPSFIVAQITMVIYSKMIKDFNHNNMVDMALQTRARERGITVNGLETLQFQSQILLGTPLKEQTASLLKFIQNFEKGKEMAANISDAYYKQDLDALLTEFNDPDVGVSKEEMEHMVFNRNRNWAKQAIDILKTPTFFVVGAGHLIGYDSFQNLLREQGYNVTPVE